MGKRRQNKIYHDYKGGFNKETSSIDLTLNPTFDNELEKKELFDIMHEGKQAKTVY